MIEDQGEDGERVHEGEEDADEEDQSKMPTVEALRGHSLRVFGPRNRFRRLCAVILRSRYVLPYPPLERGTDPPMAASPNP